MVSSRPGDDARVGVVLRPDRAHAVVVHGGAVLPVEPAAAGRADLESMLAGAVATAPGVLESVTVDISPLLLDAVLVDAVLVARELPAVAVVRIVPRPATDPSLSRSPAHLVERLVAARYTVAGGHDLLGNELCPLDRAGLAAVCDELAASGIRHIAIVSPGSQARPAHERDVADAVQAAVPGARISVASDYGGQGLVGREATVVLDCALSTLTDQLLDRCEQTLRRLPGRISLRVARGDGGYSTASRIRAMPVVALAAAEALELTGAAYLAAERDCRVLLSRAGGAVSGEVRHGLALVSPSEFAGIGTELVVPTAVLVPEPASDPDAHRVGDQPAVRPQLDPDTLACVGAAISRPTAWLDEVAYIKSAAELDGVRRDAVERASAIVMANGAAPGSVSVADVSTVALPYSPSGTVRIRVRVTGDPDPAAAGPLSAGRRR